MRIFTHYWGKNVKYTDHICILDLLKENLLKLESKAFKEIKLKFSQLDICYDTYNSIEHFGYNFSLALITVV